MKEGGFGGRKDRPNGGKRPRASTDFPAEVHGNRGKIMKYQVEVTFQRKIDIFVDSDSGEAEPVTLVSGNV